MPEPQIRRDHGDPSLEVDIIAHSMGGLATRYYTRYGTRDDLDDDDLDTFTSDPLAAFGEWAAVETASLGNTEDNNEDDLLDLFGPSQGFDPELDGDILDSFTSFDDADET